MLYTTKSGVLYKVETIDGFKNEKACLAYASIEDKHLKRIKSQTNLKEWHLECHKGE